MVKCRPIAGLMVCNNCETCVICMIARWIQIFREGLYETFSSMYPFRLWWGWWVGVGRLAHALEYTVISYTGLPSGIYVKWWQQDNIYIYIFTYILWCMVQITRSNKWLGAINWRNICYRELIYYTWLVILANLPNGILIATLKKIMICYQDIQTCVRVLYSTYGRYGQLFSYQTFLLIYLMTWAMYIYTFMWTSFILMSK